MFTANQMIQSGQYVIKRAVKSGSDAGFEAINTKTQKTVFIKQIFANKPDKQFRREATAAKARILCSLKNEHISPVLDFFTENDRDFLVFEVARFETLSELMQRIKEPLAVKEVQKWARQLVETLDLLHRQKTPIINVNLNPDNIFIKPNGNIQLRTTHFLPQDDSEEQEINGEMLPYTAFEQIWKGLDESSKKVIINSFDADFEQSLRSVSAIQTDLYSLGAILYRLVTGVPPTDALTRLIDIIEDKPDPLPFPHQINTKIQPEYADIFMKVLAIRGEDRPYSIAFLKQLLQIAEVRAAERKAGEKKSAEKEHLQNRTPNANQPNKKLEEIFSGIPVKPESAKKTPENSPVNQLELLKKQLKEAESRKSEAERRAAEAEKRLSEIIKIEKQNISAISDKTPEKIVSSSVAENALQKPSPEILPEDDFSEMMFEYPQREKSVAKKIGAAVGILVLAGGIGFGVWNFAGQSASQNSEFETAPIEAKISSQTVEKPVEIEPPAKIETAPTPLPVAPQPVTDTTVTKEQNEKIAAPAEPSKPVISPKEKSLSPAKSKNDLPPTVAPQVAKQEKPKPAEKKQEPQKKSVTLDDLLKDN